jgi:hypothetical protein
MRIRWAGHVALMEEERKVYKVLVEKPEGKRLFHPRKYSIACYVRTAPKKNAKI